MFAMNALKRNTFYRSNKEYIAPEPKDSQLKGTISVVLAPSIESEFEHIDRLSDYILLRNLKNYAILRERTYPMVGHASRRVLTDLPAIEELMKKHQTNANLQNIDNFILVHSKLKNDPLRSWNTLVEVNDDLEEFLNNPKDLRLPKARYGDLIAYLNFCLQDRFSNPIYANYSVKNLFIPINRWVADIEMYKDNKFFNVNNHNFIAMLYNAFKHDPSYANIFTGWNVILTNYNEVMILDGTELSNHAKALKADPKAKGVTFDTELKLFMKKCKSSKAGVSTDLEEDGINHEMSSVEKESLAIHKVDEILEAQGVDKSTVSAEHLDKLTEVVKSEIKDNNGKQLKIEKDVKVILQEPEANKVLGELLEARLAGKSMESYQRNKMLKEKYIENKVVSPDGKVTVISDIIKDAPIDTIKTPIHANVLFSEISELKGHNFARTYNEKLFMKDLIAILSHFATCSPAMFMVSDIEMEDVSDSLNRIMKYSVTFEDENRKRHNMKFLLPKFYQDSYLFLNGNKKDIVTQKFPFPITKINKDVVQLSSSAYNKVFVYRTGHKVSPKLTRLMKLIDKNQIPDIVVKPGNALPEAKGIMTTLEFDEFAGRMYQLSISDWRFMFNTVQSTFMIGFHPEDNGRIGYFVPLAYNMKTKENRYLDARTNEVVDEKGNHYGQLSDYIIEVLVTNHPKLEDEFASIPAGNRFIYSEAVLLAHSIPVILVTSSIARGGLSEILERAKIDYRITDKRESIDKNNEDIIPFKDGYIIYKRYPYENSILLNGLSAIPTKEYTIEEMDRRETYIEIFDILYNKRNLVEGIENFRQLFPDPILVDVQTRINSVTDFIGCLLFANDLLADNQYKSDIAYEQIRIRNNEIVLAYLYKVLADQYSRYRMNNSIKFTIPEDLVIKEILKGNSVDEHSGVNLPLEMDTDRQISTKGLVGLNVDQSYTLEKRAFHPTMVGMVGMSTAPSGSVGLKRYMTLNVPISDARGFLVPKDPKTLTGYDLQTPAELTNVYSVDSSDPARTAMATNQGKQILPTIKRSSPIISYDMERVAPYISRDFASTARYSGRVEAIENKIMIIKYDDGTYGDVDLSSNAIKHTNAGKFTMNELTPLVKVGDKVKEGQLLAVNEKQISLSDIFGDPVGTAGAMLTCMFASTGMSYEDSTYMTEYASKALGTLQTKKVDVILGKYANIKSIAKVGTEVKVGDPLLIFDDADDEFGSQLLASIDTDNDELLEHVTNSNIYSNVTGVVKDVRIYHACDEKELTPSLQKYVKELTKEERLREATLKKYVNPKDSNTIIKSTGKTQVDSMGRIKGAKVEDGVYIEFFVEFLDIISTGDKITYTSAIKGIDGIVVPDKFAPYPLNHPDRPIHCVISTIGVTKRMAHDINKLVVENGTAINHKLNKAEKYFDAKTGKLKK